MINWNAFKRIIFEWLVSYQPKKEKKEVIQTIRIINEPEWTPQHAEALSQFLRSPIGKDLEAVMNASEIRVNAFVNRNLSGSHESREFRAGTAFGFALAFSNLRNLANVQQKEEEPWMPTSEEIEEAINNRVRGML